MLLERVAENGSPGARWSNRNDNEAAMKMTATP
jgi:hypothetical protein